MIPETHKLAVDWLNHEDIYAYSDGNGVYVRCYNYDLEISEAEIRYRSEKQKNYLNKINEQ